MKKLVLVLIGISFLFACSGKEQPTVVSAPAKAVTQEQPQAQHNFSLCQINGHDCWEIIQLLKETEPGDPIAPETEMYSPDVGLKNPALEAKGFYVGYYNRHSDGGITASISWGESDFVNIGTHYADEGPNLLLIWPDGTQKKFDLQGNLVK